MSLEQFKVLILDVYGTLVDWECGIYNSLAPIFVDAGHQWSKSDVLLAFSSVELELQAKTPTALYTNILAAAYDELSRRICAQPSLPEASENTVAPIVVSGDPDKTTAAVAFSVGTSSSASSAAAASASAAAAAAAFAASLADWPIFPDTIPALAKLSTALGLKLVVLSNVDHASFAHTRAALEHGFAFAATFTAEDIGSYKPDPRNFEYAIKRLQADDPELEREQILVVAQSLPHDHVPARTLGLSSVWIDRPGALTCLDGDGVPKTRAGKEAFAKWRYRSLEEFANAVEEARAKAS